MYKIKFEGFLETGYVKFSVFKRSKTVKLNTIKESEDFATKFKSKRIANILCRFCQFASDKNFELRTYKVVELS